MVGIKLGLGECQPEIGQLIHPVFGSSPFLKHFMQ